MANKPSPTGTWTRGPLWDRYICYKHELRQAAVMLTKRLLGREIPDDPIKCRVSNREGKNLVLKRGLATWEGRPSWFYTAYERAGADPLTNSALAYIDANIPKDSRVLVTGCGTGITAFHLAEQGYREVVGADILPECIEVANLVKEKGGYHQTTFYQDDCFNPKDDGTFDLITAMHWVFSAWAGNYGNDPVSLETAKSATTREELLNEFLATYTSRLNKDGILILELTDAVADYRLDSDHRLGASWIYPVRHTPEQVERLAQANGLEVQDMQMCTSYGHQPRTSYYLKKL